MSPTDEPDSSVPTPEVDGGVDAAADDAGEVESLDRIATLLEALTTAMYECPDRAWPGVTASYRDSSQVLLVSESNGVSYLWNDQSSDDPAPAVTEVDTLTLGAEWRAALFNVGSYQGQPTLSVSLDETGRVNRAAERAGRIPWVDFALSVAFHEGFHFLSGQLDWALEPANRWVPYPESWEPRYIRTQIARAFRSELQTPGVGLVGAAAYWQEQMVTRFGDELTSWRTVDIQEGTAEYAAAVMMAVIERGCEIEEAELFSVVTGHLDELVRLDRFSAVREPYDLGVLAGFVARRARGRSDSWEARIESGSTPTEVAVEGTAPLLQADDRGLMIDAELIVDRRNVETALHIEPSIEAMASDIRTRVVLDRSTLVGPLAASGFFRLVEQPGQPHLIVGYEARYEVGGATIVFHDQAVFHDIATPCVASGSPVLVVPVPTALIVGDEARGTFSVSTRFFEVVGLPARHVENGGRTWLCGL